MWCNVAQIGSDGVARNQASLLFPQFGKERQQHEMPIFMPSIPFQTVRGAMSGSQVLTFTVGAAAGVCAASALFWAVKREKASGKVLEPEVNGTASPSPPSPPSPVAAAHAPEEQAPVPAEDRPADAPESCPGVSSNWK